jgi:heme-degrading monooxygenase HmoA
VYIRIWEYVVKPSCEERFEELYGPDGAWAILFRQGHGFIGTELLRDADTPDLYLSVDRWDSAADYRTFEGHRGDEWFALDEAGGELTERETSLGHFEGVAG